MSFDSLSAAEIGCLYLSKAVLTLSNNEECFTFLNP